MASKVTVRAYTSPTLVLLAMDWADGAEREDLLGFAILRSPGFHKGEQDGYLLNKDWLCFSGATFPAIAQQCGAHSEVSLVGFVDL